MGRFPTPRRAVTLALGAMVASAMGVVSPAPVAATVETNPSNIVIDWHIHAQETIITNAHQLPWDAQMSFAIVQGAVYDAVNAISGTHQPYLRAPAARSDDSQEAAAAAAAHRVLVGLFPDQQSRLDQQYTESLSTVPDGSAKTGGIAVGEEAAATMLADRERDGRGEQARWVVGTTPGQWRPTPPDYLDFVGAEVKNIKPFLVPNVKDFRSKGPKPLTSTAYAEEFNEVKDLGSLTSTRRTPDQTDAAVFWHDRDSPWWKGHIFDQLAVSHGLSTNDTARMLAMLHLTGADAAIACFDDKSYWSHWRPVTAIREAATDGNPATAADPDWLPLLDTPPFPDHPSGHACHSAGYVRILQSFFGTDRVAFSGYSDDSNSTRYFSTFSQALDEVNNARVWAGIHFRTADVQGAKIGKDVASYVLRYHFKPL